MPVAALGTVMICINDIDGNDHAIPLDNIAYVSRVDKNVSQCPHCGDLSWADSGQRKQMLKL